MPLGAPLPRLAPRAASAPPRRVAAKPPAAPTRTVLSTRRAPPASVEAGLAELAALAARLRASHDRRAIFADTYLIQIRALAADVSIPGRYGDPGWMNALTVDFLQRYLDAFEAYEAGDHAAVPASWRKAFGHAARGQGPAVLDLLLAMNAHINHDLPLSVAALGAPRARQADFVRFNAVLAAQIDAVQDLVASRASRPERALVDGTDRHLRSGDEALAAHLIRTWRAAAWQNATALVAEGPSAYRAVSRRAGWRAALLSAGAPLLAPLRAGRERP